MIPSRCADCGDTSRTLTPCRGVYCCPPCALERRAEAEDIATTGGVLTHQRRPRPLGLWERLMVEAIGAPDAPEVDLAALANAEAPDTLWAVVGRDEVGE